MLVDHHAPGLLEIAPLAKDLAEIGHRGSRDAPTSGSGLWTPDAPWRDGEAGPCSIRPRGQKAALTFPFTQSMRELVFAVMERSALQTEAPAQWARAPDPHAGPRRRDEDAAAGRDTRAFTTKDAKGHEGWQ